MARFRQARLPVLFVALIACVIGYIIGCSSEQRERRAQSHAAGTTEDKTIALERRISQVEDKTTALERRISQLEAKIGSEETKGPPIAAKEDWRDKSKWRSLKKNMTMGEVKRLLGEPEQVTVDALSIYLYWGKYPSGGQVTFDADTEKVYGWREP